MHGKGEGAADCLGPLRRVFVLSREGPVKMEEIRERRENICPQSCEKVAPASVCGCCTCVPCAEWDAFAREKRGLYHAEKN